MPRTVKLGMTKAGDKVKPHKYSEKKVVICYQLRPDVQTYGRRSRYTTNADTDAAEIDMCVQKCQVAA